MNPDQVALVQQSFETLFLPRTDEISARFYEHLFRIDPAMRAMFRADITSQSRKFMSMLRVTVKGLHRYESVRPAVLDLGHRHVRYGVIAAHYEPMRSALLRALHEVLGPAFTPELEQAWTAAYDLLAQEMINQI